MTDRELLQDALDALTYVGDKDIYSGTIDALRARLSQPEPAQCDGGQCGIGGYCKECPKTKSDVPETAFGEIKPVAVWELQEGGWDTIADADWMETLPVGTKLYTTPPQREWVGLTDEEVMSLLPGAVRLPPGWVDTVRAIEAKLKEKNT